MAEMINLKLNDIKKLEVADFDSEVFDETYQSFGINETSMETTNKFVYANSNMSNEADSDILEVTQSQETDIQIVDWCRNANNGNNFDSLYYGNWELEGYNTHDEADRALCDCLAFYTESREQIDRIFSGSGLNSAKWSTTPEYKMQTIDSAIADVKPKVAKKDDPNNKYFAKGGRFIVPTLADEILESCHFITFSDTNEVYHYENGVYCLGGKNQILQMAQNKLGDRYKNSLVKEVYSYVQTETLVDRNSINGEKYIVNLRNGLYDIETGQFYSHTPELLSTIQIPVDYNPDAKCLAIDKFFSEIVFEEDQQVLLEWAGYSMIPDNRMQKAVMLIGSGSNGKSVFLNLLATFIGRENTSGESLHNLERDKFSTANLYGKLLNVFSDLAKCSIYDNSTFKALVGGDYMRGEKKFQGAFNFENTARLIFSANHLPAIKDGDFAYFRRWLLIEFPNTFIGDNLDTNLINKLTTPEELSGFLNKALVALKILLENMNFSYNETVEEVQRIYQINSDTVAAFVDECVRASDKDMAKSDMYNAYTNWCGRNDITPLKDNIFGKDFKKLGYEDLRESTGDRSYCWSGVTV